jgi:hypothetical protein
MDSQAGFEAGGIIPASEEVICHNQGLLWPFPSASAKSADGEIVVEGKRRWPEDTGATLAPPSLFLRPDGAPSPPARCQLTKKMMTSCRQLFGESSGCGVDEEQRNGADPAVDDREIALDVRLPPIQVGDVVGVLPSHLRNGNFWLAKVLVAGGTGFTVYYFERVRDIKDAGDTMAPYEDPADGTHYVLSDKATSHLLEQHLLGRATLLDADAVDGQPVYLLAEEEAERLEELAAASFAALEEQQPRRLGRAADIRAGDRAARAMEGFGDRRRRR